MKLELPPLPMPQYIDTRSPNSYTGVEMRAYARTAVLLALEAAAKLAAPYHTINGNGPDGCPRFCTACSERRNITAAIRRLAQEGE